MSEKTSAVIIGAGPAGLAAAYELANEGTPVLVLEKDAMVGGLSRTVEYKGFRCDIGGHRFFTKIAYVDRLWHEVLGQDFLRRPRLSRIYYGGKFYNYPLNVWNALKNLGFLQSVAVAGSLLRSKLLPYRPQTSFTHWVSNRFGRRLFNIFFRTYTEKVWGISCDRLSADWAAQRIKNLSLVRAVLNALGIGGKKAVASLIDEFDYPALGPGQMYEEMAARAQAKGAQVRLRSKVTRIEHEGGRVRAVCTERPDGPQRVEVPGALFSSMPLDELVLGLQPSPPAEVLQAAKSLSYRSILTVNLLLNQGDLAPDTWIYIHDPSVRAGRVQFYKNWSPRMVPDPAKNVIGLEYFCYEGDELWTTDDHRLLAIATEDLGKTGLADTSAIFDSFVVRYPKAYPVYDEGYQERLAVIRTFLRTLTNLYPVGRYGQFRYNNMDHSILTAHYSVRAMHGESVDPWSVNVDQEYHEEKK